MFGGSQNHLFRVFRGFWRPPNYKNIFQVTQGPAIISEVEVKIVAVTYVDKLDISVCRPMYLVIVKNWIFLF